MSLLMFVFIFFKFYLLVGIQILYVLKFIKSLSKTFKIPMFSGVEMGSVNLD